MPGPADDKRTPRYRRAWSVERLEGRDLPSVVAILALGALRAARAQNSAQAALTPIPTRHELARERFNAHFKGSYSIFPGRFNTEAQRVYFHQGGTSNQFLHGNLLMSIATPSTPGGTITGTADLLVKNVSNTGNQLAVDLQGDPATLFRGLPTHLTWTVNGSSGGIYAGATGAGTLDIIYFPSKHVPSHSRGAGIAGVVFRGTVYTTGTSNVAAF